MIYTKGRDGRLVQAERTDFANCCGATLSKTLPKSIRTAGKGIRVFDGIAGVECSGRKIDVNHIKTRNGDLTIAVKHTP